MPYLFHYTSLKSAIKILDSSTLLAGRISGSNDPFEDVELDFYEECYDRETIKSINIDLKRYLHSVVRFMSFSRGTFVHTNRKEHILEEVDYLDDKIRPGYFYPRMWGQYGDKHCGVCLVFDQARLSKTIHKSLCTEYQVFQDRVKYINITNGKYTSKLFSIYEVDIGSLKSLRPEKYVQQLLATHHPFLYYQKDTDWRNEKEFRFLVINKYGNRFYSDLFVPFGSSLVAIVPGLRFSGKLDRFHGYALENHASLYTLKKHAGTIYVS